MGATRRADLRWHALSAFPADSVVKFERPRSREVCGPTQCYMQAAANVVPLISVAIEFSQRFLSLRFLATAVPISRPVTRDRNCWFVRPSDRRIDFILFGGRAIAARQSKQLRNTPSP